MTALSEHAVNLLVAHENEEVAALITSIATGFSWQVHVAHSAQAAQALFRTRQDWALLLLPLNWAETPSLIAASRSLLIAARVITTLDGRSIDLLHYRDDLVRAFQIGADDVTISPLDPVVVGHQLQHQIHTYQAMLRLRGAEEAERQQRELAEALRDTTAALARTLDHNVIMELILENAARVVPYRTANIILLKDGLGRVRHGRGYGTDLWERIQRVEFTLETYPLLNAMYSTGRSICVTDTRTDPRWQYVEELAWVRSYIATPIRAYDHVIGFLNLESDLPAQFEESHAERLHAFADTAAIALENAELYEAIYRDATQMRALHRATTLLFTPSIFSAENLQEIAQQIAQAVVSEFGKVDCGVFLIDSDQRTLLRLARAGEYQVRATSQLTLDGRGLVPQAIRSSTVVYAPDVTAHPAYAANDERTRSELAIPLMFAKRVLGALDLQSATLNAFDEQDQQVLIAFAERAAAAIENVRLYNDVQQRVRERTFELARVKERAEAILNNNSDAILLLSVDGRIQQVNMAFNTIFKETPDGAYNQWVHAYVQDEKPHLEVAVRRAAVEKRAVRQEIVAQRTDGSTFDADAVISPVFTDIADGAVTHVICSIRDITDRKRYEAELRAALAKERELNDLRAQFVARASHEFRTPLAMIGTSAEMLGRYFERMSAEQRQEKLQNILNQVEYLAVMLDDMLTLSRAESINDVEFHLQWVDINVLCSEIVRASRNGIGYQHDLHFTGGDPDCAFVSIDPMLFRRILLNLLSNAFKYSPAGSRVDVVVSCSAQTVSVTVADQGIGIPAADQRTLFEPFHRAHNVEHVAGTGLGLSIVRQLVERHGGRVTFESEEGKGTSFTVSIDRTTMHDQAYQERPAADG